MKDVDVELSRLWAKEIKAQPKSCWRNAYSALAEMGGGLYVEGWACDLGGLCFEHGWIETDNAIVDPTLWRDPPAYFPAQKYTFDELAEILKTNGFNLPVIWTIYDRAAREHYNKVMAQAMDFSSKEQSA